MSTCNLRHVPLEMNAKMSKATNEKRIDETRYSRSIGFLRYLLHTRLDLSFSVGLLCSYMQEPKESHGAALKQVLRYLRGTCSLELYFACGKGLKLECYSDASYNVDDDDGKSTTGHVFYLGDSPISWTRKRKAKRSNLCRGQVRVCNDDVSRISDLSNELLIKILSFLPTKVAVSTSILSKQWQFLWMWLPKLEYSSLRYCSAIGEFIDKYLPLHRSPVIERLKLSVEPIQPEDIKRWVDIAVSRCVRDLIFIIVQRIKIYFPAAFTPAIRLWS